MSDDNSIFKTGAQVLVVAAVGTLAAKLVQTGFDAVFRKKEPEEPLTSKRSVERLASATLMAGVSYAHINCLALQYEDEIRQSLVANASLDELKRSLTAICDDLKARQGLLDQELFDFRDRIDLVRSNADRLEHSFGILRDIGSIPGNQLPGPDGKEAAAKEEVQPATDNQQQPEVIENVECATNVE